MLWGAEMAASLVHLQQLLVVPLLVAGEKRGPLRWHLQALPLPLPWSLHPHPLQLQTSTGVVAVGQPGPGPPVRAASAVPTAAQRGAGPVQSHGAGALWGPAPGQGPTTPLPGPTAAWACRGLASRGAMLAAATWWQGQGRWAPPLAGPHGPPLVAPCWYPDCQPRTWQWAGYWRLEAVGAPLEGVGGVREAPQL